MPLLRFIIFRCHYHLEDSSNSTTSRLLSYAGFTHPNTYRLASRRHVIQIGLSVHFPTTKTSLMFGNGTGSCVGVAEEAGVFVGGFSGFVGHDFRFLAGGWQSLDGETGGQKGILCGLKVLCCLVTLRTSS